MVAVAAVDSVRAFDIEPRAAKAFDIELHHALGDELNHLLEQISVCPFLNPLGQCDSGLGHRGFSGECLVFVNSMLAKNHDDQPLSPRGAFGWFSYTTSSMKRGP